MAKRVKPAPEAEQQLALLLSQPAPTLEDVTEQPSLSPLVTPDAVRSKRGREDDFAGETNDPIAAEEGFTRTEAEVSREANRLFGRSGKGSQLLFERRFRAHFGVSPQVAAHTWTLLQEHCGPHPPEATMERFLWALMLMMCYDVEQVNCTKASGCDEQTFRTWSWYFVDQVSYLEPHVIRWENRKVGDEGNDCLSSCDGADFRFQASGKWARSYKYKFKTALRYIVGLCIKTGHIVYLDGPFPPGDMNDIQIFRWGMMNWLDEDERVEADDGYVGEAPKHIKCPKSFTNDQTKLAMQSRVRSRHETVNKRMKQFHCLKNEFRHHEVEKHSSCFRAVAVLTQLSIEYGEPLFEVEYSDTDIVAVNEVE